jgi:hypothetical protein
LIKKHIFILAAAMIAVSITMLLYVTPDSIASSATLNTDWKLAITGLVDEPLNLTIADLLTMPQTTLFAQIYCVGPPGFFVEEGNWTGVKLNFLLQSAGLDPSTVKIAFYATDGFTTDLTPLYAMDDSVLVAYEKNGLPIDETLRLVVPSRWGYKWIYHLSRIEAANYNFLGKYESQGYSDIALTTMTGGPGDVGNQLPNPTTLTTRTPSPTPSNSPKSSANPSPTIPEFSSITILILLLSLLIFASVLKYKKNRLLAATKN